MRVRYSIALPLLLAFMAGCAQSPYQYGQFAKNANTPEKVVVEVGGPHKRLERISDAMSWPRRTMFPELPDRRHVTSETVEQVTGYLNKNNLQDVHVSVRDYQPREQWRRLRESRVVSPLSRYTLGSLGVIGYTLFPGMVYDLNWYSPYTNTLYVNTDASALLVHEAAYARKIRESRLPGAYVVASRTPFLNIPSALDSAREVVEYAQAEENWRLEEESYEQVYPKVGTQAIAGAIMFTPVWWGGPAIAVAGSAAGGATGKFALARREAERQDVQQKLVEREVKGRDVQQASFAEPDGDSHRKYVTPSAHQEPVGRSPGHNQRD